MLLSPAIFVPNVSLTMKTTCLILGKTLYCQRFERFVINSTLIVDLVVKLTYMRQYEEDTNI